MNIIALLHLALWCEMRDDYDFDTLLAHCAVFHAILLPVTQLEQRKARSKRAGHDP